MAQLDITSTFRWEGKNGALVVVGGEVDTTGSIPRYQLPSGNMDLLGYWNASTNTPYLYNSVGTTGDVYKCNFAGTVDLGAGAITFSSGDLVYYDGFVWGKISSNAVSSIYAINNYSFTATAGQTVYTFNYVPNQLSVYYNGSKLSKNQYNASGGSFITLGFSPIAGDIITVDAYVNTLASNITGGGVNGAITKWIGTNILTSATAGTDYVVPAALNAYVPTFRQLTINGVSYDLTADRSWTITAGVTGVTASSPLFSSGGATPNITIQQSSASLSGYLSSTDWSTFNNKQSALSFGNLTSSDITITGGSNAVIGAGATLTLATVNTNTGTFGSSTAIPVITVNGKGLITAMSTTAVSIPSGSLSFIGDVTGSGTTGSNTTLTLATVNSNVFASNTFLKFAVNGKGLITSATAVISSDITGALGFTPYNATNPNSYIALTALSAGTGISYNNTTGVISSTITQYTDANARAAISLTTTGTSGVSTYNSSTGVLNIPNYGSVLTGYVPYTGATTNVNLGSNNIYANAFFNGFLNITASGTQVVLTVLSAPEILVSGSGGQTIKLPDATTLSNGTTYSFNNNQSSGAITVNNNSNTLIVSIPSGGYAEIMLLDNTTAAGGWDRHFQAPSNVSWSTNTFDYAGSITSATWNGATIAINRGGTGATTAGAALTNLGGQPLATNLTSLAGLSYASTSFVKMTASGTFALDTNTYQTVLTNPITGTGTSGQIGYFNGTTSLTSDATFTYSPTAVHLINNSVTAASAIARGTNLTPTLIASANSDVLVGLDINPIFTLGAFTGTSSLALRVTGAASFSSSITASSIIKSGGTSSQILAADGSVITAGTNITISGGTISSSGGGGGSMAIGGSITSATAGSVLYAGASGVLAQSNANFYFDYTNNRLGIGTATPSYLLDIRSNVNSGTEAIRVTNTNTGTAAVAGIAIQASTAYGSLFATSSGYTTSGVLQANRIGFYTTNTFAIAVGVGDFIVGTSSSLIERMRVTAAGNVLIGTTTDAGYKLDITGTSRLNGQTTLTGSVTASSNLAQGIIATPTLTAAANSDVLVGLDINPTFTNGAFTGVTNTLIRATYNGTSQQALMRLLSPNQATGGAGLGNIFAIGVSASTNNEAEFVFDYAGSASTSNSLGIGFYGSAAQFRIYASGETVIGSPATASGSKLTVNYTGVQNSLANFLTPAQAISSVGGGNSIVLGVSLTNNNNANWVFDYAGSGSTNNSQAFGFYGSIGFFRLYASSVVAIGMGSVVPTSKIQVNGNAAIGFSTATAAPTNGLAVSGTTLIGTTTDAGYKLDVNGTARVQTSAYFATTSGSVGIGTSSPSKLFTVVSATDGQNAGISGATYGLRFDNGGVNGFGGSTIHGTDNTLTGSYQILALSGSQLLFAIGGATIARFDTSSNLGLGTATIGSKLQVNGNAAIGYSASTAAPSNGLVVAGNMGLGTTTIASATSDMLTISKNQNAATRAIVSNTTSGTSSVAEINLTSNTTAGSFNIGKYSATTSAYKNLASNTAYLYNGTAGDIAFLNDFASGGFNISVGASSTAQFVITSGGNVLMGTTTDNGSKLQVQGEIRSQGSGATLYFQNQSNSNFYAFYGNLTNVYLYNQAVGNIGSFSPTTGIYTPLSDINKKKDFELSTIGLNAILGLKPTLYRMKTDDANSPKTLGFIAQEVKPFIPQAYVENDGFIGLNDRPIIAALVKAIQELKAEIDELKLKIK